MRARTGLPQSANTPSEVVAHLRRSSFAGADVEEVGQLLRRCDDARFAPSLSDPSSLPVEAKNLILKWDERS